MTDEQLEQQFKDAQDRWNKEHDDGRYRNLRMQRYFFWAGVSVGITATNEIHKRAYGEPLVMEITDAD